jgi:hypothetical protein
LRAGERLRITTQAGLDSLSPAAWTGLSESITNIPSSGSATFSLDVDFDCSDYASEIPIRAGTNVTIHGNGAVLDAAQQGRFFNVDSGATLALDHLTLQHGSVGDHVSADYLPPSVPGLAQTCYIPAWELELTATLPPSPQKGGAIVIAGNAICNIDGASFVSNTAGGVSQQRKKPSLTSPFARKILEIPGPDIEQF